VCRHSWSRIGSRPASSHARRARLRTVEGVNGSEAVRPNWRSEAVRPTRRTYPHDRQEGIHSFRRCAIPRGVTFAQPFPTCYALPDRDVEDDLEQVSLDPI
jgi:hypothetical protein